MSSWHVADRQGRISVLTEEALREAVAQQRLSTDTLVWREGLSAWASIEAYFPLRRRGPASGVGAVLWGFGLLLVTLLFAAALAFSAALLAGDLIDRFSRAWLLAVWLGEAGFLAIVAVLLACAWWSATADWSSMEGRGFVRILVLGVAFIGLSVAGFQALQAETVRRLTVAGDAMRGYVLTYEAGSQTLRIRGPVGPGFAEAVKAQLDAHPVRRVEITSPGGLLDPALRVGKALEARPGMTVVARELCASACLAVLMGGEQRLADYRMTIDFHASAPTAPLDLELARYIGRKQTQEARAFIIRRGAPEAYVRESERLGPGRIYRAPAALLVEQGMLTGLVDEAGAPLPLAEARRLLAVDPGAALRPFPLSLGEAELD